MEAVTFVREITPNPDGTCLDVVTEGTAEIASKYGAGEVGRCPVCGSDMYGHFEVMPAGSRWCSSCGYMWPPSSLMEFGAGRPSVEIDVD